MGPVAGTAASAAGIWPFVGSGDAQKRHQAAALLGQGLRLAAAPVIMPIAINSLFVLAAFLGSISWQR